MTDTKAVGVAYYTALGEKNMEAVKKFLHPDIQFTDPKEKVMGREAFLEAARGFTGFFKTLTIRAQFGSENQAVIIYDVEIPTCAKNLRAASLLSFQEGLISKIELIYDTQCLMEKEDA
jgi:SnoaL-like domain